MPYHLPFFGEIDFLASGRPDYFETETTLAGRPLRLDLNLDQVPALTPAHLDAVRQQLENLAALDGANRDELARDFRAGGNVAYYVRERLDHLDPDRLAEVLATADPTQPLPQQMLHALFLSRVSFYPGLEGAIVCDYTASTDYVDELVVIFRQLDGTFDDISIES